MTGSFASLAWRFLQQHDESLLALAALTAFLSAFTAIHLLNQARSDHLPSRRLWLAGAAVAGGGGAWASHFIAILAYHPGVPVRTAPGLTLLSLLVAVGATALTLNVAIRRSELAMRVCAGMLLGLGYATMHYTGMAAMVVPGMLVWNQHLVDMSLLIAAGFGAVAVPLALGPPSQARAAGAALLLGGGVCALHVMGMMAASVELLHIPPPDGDRAIVPPALLALNVAFVCCLVLLLALAALVLSHQSRRRSEAEKSNFRDLADIAVEGLLVCRGQTVVAANRSLLAMAGYSEEAIKGMPLARLFEGHATPRGEAAYPSGEKTLTGRTGERIPVEVVGKPILYMGTPHYVLALRDQRERQKTDEALRFMAHHDSLTGLANRTAFGARLALQLRDHNRAHSAFAILAIDIDRFKEVNETLGHHTGDLLLERVAHRLRATVRDSDCVARLGGDEFAVLAHHPITEETVLGLAERIIEVLARPFILDGKIINAGGSIGIAVAPQDGDDATTLMKNVELALNRAKSVGRNTARRYEPGMDVELQTRRELELDLRRALVHKQFEMQYQPLLNLRSQSVYGFEALLRWRHPVRGLIPPGSFIPLAENTGLILPIGEYVLQASTMEASSWDESVCVSVNLSPAQFAGGKLVETVRAALDRSGLSPRRLELEITESVLLQESEDTLRTLHALRGLGVRIAMDDFGTGYSSLRYLKDFPFDRIKIDRSFIAAMLENQESAAIISAVVALSQRLGIATTAEGVETEEQMARIRDEGCDTVQGYLIGRPTPPDELGRFFTGLARVTA